MISSYAWWWWWVPLERQFKWKIFCLFYAINIEHFFLWLLQMHSTCIWCNSRSCLRARITSLNKFLIKFIWLFINMISFDVNKHVFYACFDERCDHKYWGSRINHKNQFTGILCHPPFSLWLIIMCINDYYINKCYEMKNKLQGWGCKAFIDFLDEIQACWRENN